MPSVPRLGILAIPVASLLLLLALIMSAKSAAASDDSFSTTLHPGWNLIGWIQADASVDQVFEQIAELDLIVDAAGTQAARSEPGSLRRLLSGEGYWFRLNADAPVEWIRPASRVSNTVDVAAGVSIAPWAGGANVPIGAALDELGDNLRVAWRWDPAAQDFRSWSPRFRPPYADDLPLRHGDALMLSLTAPATWEQPSTDFPLFDFAPQIPEDVRRAAVAETRLVIDQFQDLFEFTGDPDRVQINVRPPSADSELDSRSSVYIDSSSGRLQIEMSSTVWQTSPADSGDPQAHALLRDRYFRAIQLWLAGDRIEQVPPWLQAARPLWAKLADSDPANDSPASGSDLAAQYILADQPMHLLASTVQEDDPYAWTAPAVPTTEIGRETARWLADRHGAPSLIDFWRNLADQDAADADWRRAFEQTFAQSVEAFYAVYNNELRERYPIVAGRIAAPSWIRLDRLDLTASTHPDAAPIVVPITFYGEFRAALPANVDLRLRLSLPRAFCSGFGAADGRIVLTSDVPAFTVDAPGKPDLTVTIPDDFCSTYIGGRVVDPAGDPVAGIAVGACREGAPCAEIVTDADGRFYILTTGEFDYHLRLTDPLENCSRFYRRGATTNAEASRSVLQVGPDSGRTVQIRVPPSLCWSEITGVLPNLPETAPRMRLLGLNSNVLEVRAIDVEDGSVYHGIITGDGRWTIAVPGDRYYRLRFEPRFKPAAAANPGCAYEYRDGSHDNVFVGPGPRIKVTAELPDNFCP